LTRTERLPRGDFAAWVGAEAGPEAVIGIGGKVEGSFASDLSEQGFHRADEYVPSNPGRYWIQVDFHDALSVRELATPEQSPRLIFDRLRMPRGARRQEALLCAYLAAQWWHRLLDRGELDADPILQFQRWFDEAKSAGISEANAMSLATAEPDGHPSARMVLLKGADQDGFVFYTNYGSQKARELTANPRAALVFFWPQLHRQVRITGSVEKTSRSESEAYFQTRPRGSQIAAWASWQSSIIPDREDLEARVRKIDAKHARAEVPLPPNWGGYRLHPVSIEFWQGRPDRLHDRLRYSRRPKGGWKIERLAP
jgi:pyridoxamine 5'-phosphate oxidase